MRTLSSRLLSESIKERRLIVCMQALDAFDQSFPSPFYLIQVFGPPPVDEVMQSIQIGHLLRSRCRRSKDENTLLAQMLVAGIIASVPERNGHWRVLVMDQLRISEDVLEDYLAHGDSVLLANWIHITRQFFRFSGELGWMPVVLRFVQSIISKFDIRNTLPGLQHNFCALWNKLIRETHHIETYDSDNANSFLRSNRHHIIALHQGTDNVPTAFDGSTNDSDSILGQPSSYPLCNIPGHHSDGATDETTHSLIHSSPVHPPDADLNSISLAAPDVPSFPAFTPDYSCINLTEQSSLHGVSHATSITQSSHFSSPVNVGDDLDDFSTTLPDLALTIETESHAVVISPMDNSESDTRPAMVASTAISLSLPSSGAVDRQYKMDLDVDPPSITPGIPPSPSPVPVSSDTRLADPLMSSTRSPTSHIDLITSGSRLLTPGSVPEISFTPPQMTSNSQSNLAQNDATFNIHDDSQTPRLSDTVETSKRPHQPAVPALVDTVTDLSRHPVNTAPSRSVDRPH
jgi:hypothetical protein